MLYFVFPLLAVNDLSISSLFDQGPSSRCGRNQRTDVSLKQTMATGLSDRFWHWEFPEPVTVVLDSRVS